MLFNSLSFIVFLPIVFWVYWKFQRSLRAQNFWLLFVSYVFYGWWDWRFLSLILASTIVDFLVGQKIEITKSKKGKRNLLLISLIFNLGLLGTFKYFNFFIESFNDFLGLVSEEGSFNTLDIILPVGISFYTFQTLSYTIDVYKGKLKPTKSFIEFASFVSFFPQLVAGPIERASHLIPQFQKPRKFSYGNAVLGMRQILWGLFKKVVIADNLSVIVDDVFNNYETLGPFAIILGFVSFSFQIYCDFSGYSDIAIGTAKLFGFDLMKNFSFPYFAKSIADFWRRWHISLTTWFRDYIYFPLGGSKRGLKMALINTIIVFAVSGFWHGANWTFIVWGLINAMLFIPGLIYKRNSIKNNILKPFKVFWTFILITITWVFFRSKSLSDAFEILKHSVSDFTYESLNQFKLKLFKDWEFYWIVLLILMVIIEFFGRKRDFALQSVFPKSKILRWLSYFVIIVVIGFTMQVKKEGFIYFQF